MRTFKFPFLKILLLVFIDAHVRNRWSPYLKVGTFELSCGGIMSRKKESIQNVVSIVIWLNNSCYLSLSKHAMSAGCALGIH